MRFSIGVICICILIVFLAVGVGLADESGLVCYLPFDEVSQDGDKVTTPELAGGGSAVVTNAVVIRDGIKGAGLDFYDGGSVVEVVLKEAVEGEFTISAWVKTESYSRNQIITSHYGKGAYVEIFDGVVVSELKVAGKEKVSLKIESEQIVNDNEFHHVAMVWDGYNLMQFVDGGLVEVVSKPYLKGVTLGRKLDIGAVYKRLNRFMGVIDEVKIFNKALSGSEIAAQYDSLMPAKEKPAAKDGKVVLWASSPLVKILKGDRPGSNKAKSVSMECWRNEYEAGQVGIYSVDHAGKLSAKLTKPVHKETGGVLEDVEVNFVGQTFIKNNHYAMRDYVKKSPGDVPDLLIYDEFINIEPGQSRSLWITVKTAGDTESGDYEGRVDVIAGGERFSIDLEVKVYPYLMPDERHFYGHVWGGGLRQAFANGLVVDGEYDDIYDNAQNNVKGGVDYLWENDCDGYWELLKKQFANKKEHRINSYSDVPNWNICKLIRIYRDSEDEAYRFDYRLMDRLFGEIEKGFGDGWRVTCCGAPVVLNHVKSEETLNICDIDVYGSDGEKNAELSLKKGMSFDDEEVKDFLRQLYSSVEEHLEAKGWLGNVYFKVYDEPQHPEVAKAVHRTIELISEASPKLRQNTTMSNARYIGDYSEDLEIIGHRHLAGKLEVVMAEMEKGKEVWLYNSSYNRLDAPLNHLRSIGWVCYKYGISGYAEWGWSWEEPGSESVRLHGPGTHYQVDYDKGRGRIVNSIRYETLRESFEDYEYLWRLEDETRKVAQMLGLAKGEIDCSSQSRELAHEIVKYPNVYVRDVESFNNVRRKISAAIGELRRRPLMVVATVPDATVRLESPAEVTVVGAVEKGATVEINSEPVEVDAAGRFTCKVKLVDKQIVIETKKGDDRKIVTREFDVVR